MEKGLQYCLMLDELVQYSDCVDTLFTDRGAHHSSCVVAQQQTAAQTVTGMEYKLVGNPFFMEGIFENLEHLINMEIDIIQSSDVWHVLTNMDLKMER
ncbi:hypothetical protein C0J52_06952 [Blattella germanica]|nr:hypothetical protein C0J52_06952 [Blattella germanica]